MRAVRLVFLAVLSSLLIPACGTRETPPTDAILPTNLPDATYPAGHPLVVNVPQSDIAAGYERQNVDAVNQWRASKGLPPLQDHRVLDAIARGYSAHMPIEPFFAHLDPEGDYLADRLFKACGVVFVNAVENIAFMQDPTQAFTLFLNSPPHRANIESNLVNTIGVGLWRDALTNRWYVTYEFLYE